MANQAGDRVDFRDASDLQALPARWQPKLAHAGRAEPSGDGIRLLTPVQADRVYSNAQFDDYQGLPRRAFPWRPPLTLSVRARFSHEPAASDQGPGLLGTAGFGFWNDPFMMTDPRPPSLPRAIWFFYASPPSNLKLDARVPGYGWKAQAMDALRVSAIPAALAAPLLVPLFHIDRVYRTVWPLVQRSLNICDAAVPVRMTEWHTYSLEWDAESAAFSVDGVLLLKCPFAPRGPLGLVIWKDNQYMIATPGGRLGHGVVSAPEAQWLELESVEISSALGGTKPNR